MAKKQCLCLCLVGKNDKENSLITNKISPYREKGLQSCLGTEKPLYSGLSSRISWKLPPSRAPSKFLINIWQASGQRCREIEKWKSKSIHCVQTGGFDPRHPKRKICLNNWANIERKSLKNFPPVGVTFFSEISPPKKREYKIKVDENELSTHEPVKLAIKIQTERGRRDQWELLLSKKWSTWVRATTCWLLCAFCNNFTNQDDDDNPLIIPSSPL